MQGDWHKSCFQSPVWVAILVESKCLSLVFNSSPFRLRTCAGFAAKQLVSEVKACSRGTPSQCPQTRADIGDIQTASYQFVSGFYSQCNLKLQDIHHQSCWIGSRSRHMDHCWVCRASITKQIIPMWLDLPSYLATLEQRMVKATWSNPSSTGLRVNSTLSLRLLIISES